MQDSVFDIQHLKKKNVVFSAFDNQKKVNFSWFHGQPGLHSSRLHRETLSLNNEMADEDCDSRL